MPVSAPARFATERTDRPSFGGLVAEVASMLGIVLMSWQRQVLDIALEHDDDGRLAYRDVVLTIPRQGGKTTLIKALLVWRLLASPGQQVVYGAQSRVAARSKLFDLWWPEIAKSELGPMFSISRANGAEALRCANSSMLKLLSTEEASGHGDSVNLAIVDECWSLLAAVEQGVRPALSTKSNGQFWQISTAGTARSTWWRGRVDVGREAVAVGADSGICFFEWSAPSDADPSDPATWAAANPAIGRTIDVVTVAADHRAMALPEFRRAYLNQWTDDLDDSGWRLVDRDLWEASRL